MVALLPVEGVGKAISPAKLKDAIYGLFFNANYEPIVDVTI